MREFTCSTTVAARFDWTPNAGDSCVRRTPSQILEDIALGLHGAGLFFGTIGAIAIAAAIVAGGRLGRMNASVAELVLATLGVTMSVGISLGLLKPLMRTRLGAGVLGAILGVEALGISMAVFLDRPFGLVSGSMVATLGVVGGAFMGVEAHKGIREDLEHAAADERIASIVQSSSRLRARSLDRDRQPPSTDSKDT